MLDQSVLALTTNSTQERICSGFDSTEGQRRPWNYRWARFCKILCLVVLTFHMILLHLGISEPVL